MVEQPDTPDDLLASLLASKPHRQTTNGRHRLPLYEIVRAISEDIGWRPAGSRAEAQAAGYLVQLWERADVWFWQDTFPTATALRPIVRLLCVLSIATVLSIYVSLWLALFCALACTLVAYQSLMRDVVPLQRARGTSQNVLAIRKSLRRTLRRVVICAPLDVFAAPLRHGQPRTHLLVATIQSTLIVLSLIDPLPGLFGPSAMTIPVAWMTVLCVWYFLVMVVLDAHARRPVRSAGAISHAGALAVLAGSFDEIGDMPHTEVWAVALGASSLESGAVDLLQRYPFDPETTFFIGLAGIGRGPLAYGLYHAYDRGRPVDALLIEMAHQLHADTAIEPRVTQQPALIRPFLRRQFRAIEITCLDGEGLVPLQGSPHDTVAAVNPHILQRAMRVVVTMTRSIDPLSLSPTQLHSKD